MARPLDGITVLDLTRARSGPNATRQLGDWGARVIKIETPEALDPVGDLGGDRNGPDFQNLHRNKLSITLNLKAPEGIEILKALAVRADVLVENYRPDVKTRLGIDYPALEAINPRLIYASISGFGQDGPYADRPGFDQVAQGMGGMMSITGLPGQGPVRAGIPLADLTAGLYCAFGVVTALFERSNSGRGQWVTTSLLEAQIAMLDFQATRWLIGGEVPGQAGNDHPTVIPTGVFATTDGHVNIAAAGENVWRRLPQAIGAPELAEHPDYATSALRSRHRATLNAAIGARLALWNTAEAIERLNQAGVPCGPINRIDQVFADPQVRHLGIAQAVEHPTLGPLSVVGPPVHLSRTPSRLDHSAPARGQHTDTILGELGYDQAALARLRLDQVI